MKVITNISDVWNGDIILVSTLEGFLQGEIQKFQKNPYNHAGKLIWIRNKLYISEAVKTGIALTEISYYTSQPDKYKLLILRPKESFTEEEIDMMFGFMIPKTGHVRYEFLNLLVYQPIKFLTFGLVWFGAKTDKKADKRYICGEWVARIDNVVRGYFDVIWHKVAPVDLYNSEYYNHYILTIKN